MDLSGLGEFGFLERVRAWLPGPLGDGVLVGNGDDAAVMRTVQGGLVAATADALVEGVHFRLDWSSPADVGWKAVCVNVSDLAAMGAAPRWLLVTLCAPPQTDVEVLRGLYQGIGEACSACDVEVVGGDTVRADELVVAVTAIGEIEGEPMRRTGARVGDVLAVTGSLGRAAAGVNLLLAQDPRGVSPEDAMACMQAHRRPVARVTEGAALKAAGVHASIDLSDGLASDVRRLCEASEVGVEIDASRVPIAPEAERVALARGWDALQMVLGGGEDFELLVAMPEGLTQDVIEIGRVVADGLWLVQGGDRRELTASGYDHFRAQDAALRLPR